MIVAPPKAPAMLMKSVKLGIIRDITVIKIIKIVLDITILVFFTQPVACLKKGICSRMSNAHKICTGYEQRQLKLKQAIMKELKAVISKFRSVS